MYSVSMKMPFTRIAAVLFGLGALVHLLRLIVKFQIFIGGVEIPLWANIIGFLIASTFAFMLWKESEK